MRRILHQHGARWRPTGASDNAAGPVSHPFRPRLLNLLLLPNSSVQGVGGVCVECVGLQCVGFENEQPAFPTADEVVC